MDCIQWYMLASCCSLFPCTNVVIVFGVGAGDVRRYCLQANEGVWSVKIAHRSTYLDMVLEGTDGCFTLPQHTPLTTGCGVGVTSVLLRWQPAIRAIYAYVRSILMTPYLYQGRPVATPDLLFLDNIIINGHQVNWIDVSDCYLTIAYY